MGVEKRELVLIDGSSLAYRAFYALPETIATSKGEPTNAILGFAQMLTRLITDYGFRPTIVAWDKGHSGRREIYPEYKAGRISRPDLLKEQWPHLEGLCSAFGHLNAAVEGCEADDVIATLAERAKKEGIHVTIVTGDRDALQLVDDLVTVVTTGRGVSDVKAYDAATVLERYGVGPELVADLIGLKGDSSDNLPGVPGVGEKTASALLAQYGSLEAVIEHVDEVKGPKRQEAIREHADVARMCRDIATAQRDLPLDLAPSDAPTGPPDAKILRDTFRRWEMREPLKRLERYLGVESTPDEVTPDEPTPANPTASVVKPRVTEGTAADAAEFGEGPLAVTVSGDEPPEGALFADDTGVRFAVTADGKSVLTGPVADVEELVTALGERPIVSHDAKSLGWVPAQVEHDTMIAAHLLDPARRGYALDELSAEVGIAASGDDELVTAVMCTYGLAAVQRPMLSELDLTPLFRDVEIPAISVLRKMERVGVLLDIKALETIAKRIRKAAADVEKQIHELAGEEFSVGSPQQVGGVLFEKLGLTKGRKGKTGYSTDARVLQSIRSEHPIVALIEEWRETTKLISTYLDALPKLVSPVDGRIHTTFNQAATATGRLSSTDPNLQNIPVRTARGKEIRACFVAPEGSVLVSCDYSQVELRILAHLADDKALKQIFREGDDVHTATAAEVFGIDKGSVDGAMRTKAKMINYGIVYGLSAFGLADRLDIPQSEAKEFIERYFAGFPALKEYMDSAVVVAETKGYAETLLGRRRPIPELRARNPQVRQLGARLAVNTVVQGTAADIMKLGMLRCAEALDAGQLQARLLLQVHDELLLEAPKAEAEEVAQLASAAMIGAYELDPPLVVDSGFGPNWLDAK
ncbi:MAG: DNA polymerase I [Solirubrobacterales bacterium]|nr:DNA polymerase I [Solirubrobacterales bacterium]